VLAEFALDMPVRLAVEDPAVPPRMTSLAALLPDAFRAEALK
jgi:cytidine deaminase